jgi:hypothetical protein
MGFVFASLTTAAIRKGSLSNFDKSASENFVLSVLLLIQASNPYFKEQNLTEDIYFLLQIDLFFKFKFYYVYYN